MLRLKRFSLFHAVVAAVFLASVSVTTSSTAMAAEGQGKWLDVEVGQSFIFRQDKPIARVLISDDAVAQIKILEEGQFQVRGKAVGTTDLWVWYRDDVNHPVSYELTIHRDLSELVRRIDAIVDGTPPRVYPVQERLVIDGPVDSVETLEHIAAMARIYDEDFVNNMAVTGDHQIQLEVVFAEVNKTALRELGMNALYGDNALGIGMAGPNTTTATVTGARPGFTNFSGGAPSLVGGAASGAFNVLGSIDNIDLTAILSVLEQNNVSKVLARPTLVALSGQQAEFLSGGEIPIPVAQLGNRITIDFKEYGVKLVFVPTVLGNDVVDMRVYVEVSDIDSSTSIRVTGIEIPGFVARKSQSHVRVESGKTFAMAGMLQETVNSTVARVPVLGDIPIIGSAFRFVQHRRTESELMIFVTPRLVRPMTPGEVPAYPGTTEDNNPTDFELFLLGFDHRVGTQTAEPTGPVGLSR
jgi:pilus assembly protein CpaC